MQRIVSVVVTLCLLLVAAPAVAQEQIDEAPPLTSFTSARFDVAPFIFNGQPVIVGKGEMASPSRAHLTLTALPFGDQPAQTLEIIHYDGTLYVREDTSTQWYIDAETNGCCVPPANQGVEQTLMDFGAEEYTLTRIGPATIAGAPTMQYQVWLPGFDAPRGRVDHITLDFWIGQEQTYLHQIQLSAYGEDDELGPVSDAFVERFYDFNATDIVITPPADAVPRALGGPGLLPDLQLGGLAQALLAPLNTPALRAMVLQQLGR